MEHPGFFDRAGPFSLSDVAQIAGAEIGRGAGATPASAAALPITDVRPLDMAGSGHVSFLDNRKYLAQLQATRAAACFVAPAFADRVPAATVPLVTRQPYRAFALALTAFYPDAGRPKVAQADRGAPHVHPSAHIEEGASIEPGAVVGREAQVGRGTVIAAGAVIGYRVCVGRDGYVGPHTSLTHALIGNKVVIHAGVRIGQDGFGFAMGPEGHLKVPQIGRVIVQDNVEIGANTCIDRGALKDTIIGEGSKIDNLVQIGHNVVVGRHCVIVAHVGISGSSELGDFVVVGGQVGITGHIKIGAGAQVAAQSGVTRSIPPGARWGGSPARPMGEWAREIAAVRRLAARGGKSAREDEAPTE